MKVIKKTIEYSSRSDIFTLYPIGDIHIGTTACDEKLLEKRIATIASDDNAYWLAMGDCCNFINMRDPRFDPGELASWIKVENLTDISKKQVEKVTDMLKPIAKKCVGVIEGNHEYSIKKYYERDVHLEIVSKIKEYGGFDDEQKLSLGIYGWLVFRFMRKTGNSSGETRVTISAHHGYVGGRLAGGKALEMQRWLWTHDCDIALFGHSHNTAIQVEQIEGVNKAGKIVNTKRYGCYTGSFMGLPEDEVDTYSQRKGYLPIPLSGIKIDIRPGCEDPNNLFNISII